MISYENKWDNINVKDFVIFAYKYLTTVTVTVITAQGCWLFFSLCYLPKLIISMYFP